jgi:hypothetical protein
LHHRGDLIKLLLWSMTSRELFEQLWSVDVEVFSA